MEKAAWVIKDCQDQEHPAGQGEERSRIEQELPVVYEAASHSAAASYSAGCGGEIVLCVVEHHFFPMLNGGKCELTLGVPATGHKASVI